MMHLSSNTNIRHDRHHRQHTPIALVSPSVVPEHYTNRLTYLLLLTPISHHAPIPEFRYSRQADCRVDWAGRHRSPVA